jgi:hypothetical protein
MHELTLSESSYIAGGLRDADIIADAALITAAAILLTGYTPGPYYTPSPYISYEPVVTETYMPIYDGYGRYQGNMVDSYVTYEPVVYYYY